MDRNIEQFVTRWAASSAAERENKDLFLTELCDVIGVPHPNAATGDLDLDTYVFERKVCFPAENGVVPTGRIDLYKEGCFLLEAKQGSSPLSKKIGSARRSTAQWNIIMEEAYGQALGYAKCFDRPPPFLIVCDIGHCFDIYCSFDGSTVYRPYNGTQGYRFYLSDLEKHAATLRHVMTEPFKLDYSRHAARITRDVAGHLADLAKALEKSGHPSDEVATFLMRCIFTMFAEDVELLPAGTFSKAIEDIWIPHPEQFAKGVESLWKCMNEGSQFGFLGRLLRFNGGLFRDSKALPLDRNSLRILLEAAKCNWSEVEPAIFGTLLERAIDPRERHRLGAHYTPRAYVERLVRPTIEEPLRAQWDIVRAEIADILSTKVGERVAFSVADGADLTLVERKYIKRANAGKRGAETSILNRAREKVNAFHKKLCETRVLDPACGTGNFLYVTLAIFRQLEDEVLRMLGVLGEPQEMLRADRIRVTPAQFLGIEVKRWAKEIAELVLWIGYLQAHFKTYGKGMPVPEPVLQDYKNIENRDAVLAWDQVVQRVDKQGRPVTRWDGETMKTSPITGELVPDEKETIPVMDYINPRKAAWPEADYIIGNPPFIGNKRMRTVLGDGYVEALRRAHDDVPDTTDYVMYWWNHAAQLLTRGDTKRFGLISTNSITQTFSRRVVEQHMGGDSAMSIVFAIPDHPWVDSQTSAAVRIAMTVVQSQSGEGTLAKVTREQSENEHSEVEFDVRTGTINPDLTLGVRTTELAPLRSNSRLGFRGITLVGDGFILEPGDALNRSATVKNLVGARALLGTGPQRRVIDLYGLDNDSAKEKHPAEYQRLHDRVRPARLQQKRAAYADQWWIFAEPRGGLRQAVKGLRRYIATVETSRHRWFSFVSGNDLPEQTLIAIALDDAFFFGVLESKAHVTWSRLLGARLGVGNDLRYTLARCFDTFPFPVCPELQKKRIQKCAEALDAHRKRRQAEHPGLTVTEMYNVLSKMREGRSLTEKERGIHENGLVSVLGQMHDDLDAAVGDAYGWPRNIDDEQILKKLVTLNAERATEERKGQFRWLRPEVQNPEEVQTKKQRVTAAAGDSEESVPPSGPALIWPKTLAEQLTVVRDRLVFSARVWSKGEMASRFTKAPPEEVAEVLDALVSLGLVVTYEATNGRRWMVPAPASSHMAA